MPNPTDSALIALTTARLTRLVTHDKLGEWFIANPIDQAIHEHSTRHLGEEPPWWYRYRQGLDCPWCVSFWAGLATVTTYAASGVHPALRALWRIGAGAFSASYVAGTLSTAVDYLDKDDHYAG